MLNKLKEFKYFNPTSITGALFLLNQFEGNVKILAGGTDLLVRMKKSKLDPGNLIDIKYIPNLNYIEIGNQGELRIGALTTIRDIERSDLIRDRFNLISQAAEQLGSIQIRNRATIGGNLCNASPSAEMAPGLLVLNSKLKIINIKGSRVISIENFFTGPSSTVLKENEILVEIIIPPIAKQNKGIYIKHSQRKAMDIAVVSVAVLVILGKIKNVYEEIRIGLGAVSPTPIRVPEIEKLLKSTIITDDLVETVSQMASKVAFPINDIRSSKWYREEMIKALIKKALRQVLKNYVLER